MAGAQIPIGGEVKPGFEAVRDAFITSFTCRGELGAACTIFYRGEKVVDLWGGYKTSDCTAPWEEDTIVLVYSISKGVSALASAHAVSRGKFGYDDLVKDKWPEFGCNNKEDIKVWQLLSEQGGLCAIDTKLNAAAEGDPRRLGEILAKQAPEWKPGEWAGNHADTIGWLHSELISHTDTKNRTLGQYFADEIATPLGLDFHFGLPASENSRMARIKGFFILSMLLHMDTLPWKMVLCMLMPWTLTFKTLANPLVLNPALLDTPDYWRAENGGAGGIGSARALATLYSEFATGGKKLGITEEVLNRLRSDAIMPTNGWNDQVLKTDVHYWLGLEKPFNEFSFNGGPSCYGTFAVGGSMAFADPTHKVGYAYTTNKLGFHKWNDPREKGVRDAFYDIIRRD